ncbi:hypothetical protein LWI28_022519 [Acer negundo]|uniref:Uncharacterized protein n=1 Tax=Acer negundo TaxID=4023 RepID=A0AAD5IFR1_ACENE|nr:hypothetical protein LWI28_022519 [Acer negundo]
MASLAAQKNKSLEFTLNRDFDEQLEKYGEKKILPERGIKLNELIHTPIPAIVRDIGWGGLATTPLMYSERIVREFYAGMNPGKFMRGGLVLVRGVLVYRNAVDINIYFGSTLLEIERMWERMIEGITLNQLYERGSMDFANTITIIPMTQWIAMGHPLKHSNLRIELAFWNMFITASLRPDSHRSTDVQSSRGTTRRGAKESTQSRGWHSCQAEFDRVIPDEERFDDDDDNDDDKAGGTPTVIDDPSQPIGLWILDGVESIIGTQDDDFDILHVDGLDLVERQNVLKKNQADISSWQIGLESLIRGLIEIVITGFIELREELKLTPYVRRPRRTTSPTPVPSAKVTTDIPPMGAIVAGPSSSDAPVSTLDLTRPY